MKHELAIFEGYNHREQYSYVYKTTDGGENWKLVYEIGARESGCNKMCF